jgi:serine/threonine protein phosphatase PrpC
MKYGVESDKGRVRELNEDYFNILAGHPNIPLTMMIADGMGGHNSGEIASKMAVECVSNYILKNPDKISSEKNIEENIIDVVNRANDAVYTGSLKNVEYSGMGTTMIVSVVLNNKMYIGHVGDSRVYLIREGTIKRLTTDHSYIEELIKNGSLTREQAENHPQKHIITRALGCEEIIEVDFYTCELHKNDIFVLCTDGLTNMISEQKIMEVVCRHKDPQQACKELVELANKNGGIDNITVIVLQNH